MLLKCPREYQTAGCCVHGWLVKDHGTMFFAGMEDLSNEVRLKLGTAGEKVGDE